MSLFQEKTADVVARLQQLKVVPVLVLNSVDDGLRVCELLVKNGLAAAEITFRTSAAESVIRAAAARFPELYLGAGTILNTADLHRAFDAGAKFAVAPGFNPTVVKAAIAADLAFAPGVCTPSEMEQAYELGCTFLKFFPAEPSGGIKYLKSIAAPYKHLGIRFMPTGGISSVIAADYLAAKDLIVAIGGTWMVKSDDLAAKNWDAIDAAIRDTVAFTKKF